MLTNRPPVAERTAYESIISIENSADTPSVEMLATELIQQHPHFLGRQNQVRFRCQGKRLTIEGNLPTYFLKQLAQEAIRSLSGVEKIDNQIVVAELSMISLLFQVEGTGVESTSSKPKINVTMDCNAENVNRISRDAQMGSVRVIRTK